ncbi:MAG: hypothetical protein P4M08_13855 [Oligoflexia bacterium]|nr:hypothetical protein [Oligoflexia bacterium]
MGGEDLKNQRNHVVTKGIKAFPLMLFFCSSLTYAGVVYSLPATATDLERIELLQAIQREFPAFLKNGTAYGFDPFAVLSDQQKLVEVLSAFPDYSRLMAERPSLLRIEIQKKLLKTTITQFDPNRLLAWKERLEQTCRLYPDPQAALLEALTTLNKRSAETMLNVLIGGLPDGQKSKAFRQPGFDAKLSFLKNSPDIPRSIDLDLQEIRSVALLENRIQELTTLSLFLQREPGVWLTGDDANNRVSSLSESDFNVLLDFKHFIKDRFDALNRDIGQRQHHTALRISVVEKINKYAKTVLGDATIVEAQGGPANLRLTELRPVAGIFRGCAGGDCSTKNSFAAPNSPDELVFHVTDEKGESKGYLEATRVLAEGKPTLYVSSVNGLRISASDVDLLLNGLYKARAQIGFELLALPTSGNIDALMNYKIIQDRMYSLIASAKKVKLTFTVEEIRRRIEQFKSSHLSSKFDQMENNRNALLYSPSTDDLNGIETVTHEIAPQPIRIAPLTDKADLLRFAIEMKSNETLSFAFERVLSALSVSPQAWAKFIDIRAKNPERKTVAAFETEMKANLAQLLRESHPDPKAIESIFLRVVTPAQALEARLASPDPISADNLGSTIQMAESIIDDPILTYRSDDILGYNRIKGNPIFADSRATRVKLFALALKLELKYGKDSSILAAASKIEKTLGIDQGDLAQFKSSPAADNQELKPVSVFDEEMRNQIKILLHDPGLSQESAKQALDLLFSGTTQMYARLSCPDAASYENLESTLSLLERAVVEPIFSADSVTRFGDALGDILPKMLSAKSSEADQRRLFAVLMSYWKKNSPMFRERALPEKLVRVLRAYDKLNIPLDDILESQLVSTDASQRLWAFKKLGSARTSALIRQLELWRKRNVDSFLLELLVHASASKLIDEAELEIILPHLDQYQKETYANAIGRYPYFKNDYLRCVESSLDKELTK